MLFLIDCFSIIWCGHIGHDYFIFLSCYLGECVVRYDVKSLTSFLELHKAAEENCQMALKLNPGNENAKALLGDMKKE